MYVFKSMLLQWTGRLIVGAAAFMALGAYVQYALGGFANASRFTLWGYGAVVLVTLLVGVFVYAKGVELRENG